MKEWFCTNCNQIVNAKNYKCCGPVEEFDPVKHAQYIIGKSNAWITIWEKWKDHPLLKEISNELIEEGCYCAATILNIFIERLEDQSDEI